RSLRWIAAGLLLLFPFYLFDSAVDFRQWDQPFGALILLCGWWTLESSLTPPWRSGAVSKMAGLTAIGALFSASILPTLLASLIGLIWTRRKIERPARSALISAGIIAACLLPWGVRNQVILGKFILLRSNFALELATGNAPEARG